MSYLHTPRIHFSGGFNADPSTVNNTAAHFNPATPAATLTASTGANWNPNGRHIIGFDGCKVRTAVATTGPVADGLVDGDVTLSGRLVDIDVTAQTFSQIWGGTVTVSLKTGGGSFTGVLRTTGLRDLWPARGLSGPGGMPRLGGVYQSLLENVTFNAASTSPIFQQLRTRASAAGNMLSIKFVLYVYNPDPASPTFTKGKVVGTIGPHTIGEPEHIVPTRKLVETGASAWGEAPFLIDTARSKLVIDLGNSVPEDPPGGARPSVGTLTPKIMAGAPIALASLDYSLAHYLTTAGVEEVTVSAAQITSLASNRLALEKSTPVALVLQERPGGSFVDATEIVLRLYAGNGESITLHATEFGRPKSGLTINLSMLSGTPPGALTFPASVSTNAAGLAVVTFSSSDPASPRGAFLDGQLYRVGFFVGAVAASNRRGQIVVRVFDDVAPNATPTWTDVQPIFQQYSRLYPSMRNVFDLANTGILRGLLPTIKAALATRGFTAYNYMPVTRDLSPKKRDMIIRWIDNGAPGIP